VFCSTGISTSFGDCSQPDTTVAIEASQPAPRSAALNQRYQHPIPPTAIHCSAIATSARDIQKTGNSQSDQRLIAARISKTSMRQDVDGDQQQC